METLLQSDAFVVGIAGTLLALFFFALVLFPIWMWLHCLFFKRGWLKKFLWLIFLIVTGHLGTFLYGVFGTSRKWIQFFTLLNTAIIGLAVLFVVQLMSYLDDAVLLQQTTKAVFNKAEREWSAHLEDASQKKSVHQAVPASQNEDVENAATYYLRAIALMQYPQEGDFASFADNIIVSGWTDPSGEFKTLIQSHYEMFAVLQNARHIKRCDFDFGQDEMVPYIQRVDRLPLGQLFEMVNLIILKARYEESVDNYAQAMQWYLSALQIGAHAAQDDEGLIGSLLSHVIEERVIPIVDYLLNSRDLDKAALSLYVRGMSQYAGERYDMGKIYTTFGESEMTIYSDLAKHTRTYADQYADAQDIRQSQQALGIAKGLMARADERLKPYYDLLTAAVRSDEDAAWQRVDTVYQELHKAPDSKYVMRQALRIWFYFLMGREEKSAYMMGQTAADIMICVAVPRMTALRETISAYYETEKTLDRLIERASDLLLQREMDEVEGKVPTQPMLPEDRQTRSVSMDIVLLTDGSKLTIREEAS